MSGEWKPKAYAENGRTLKPRENISAENMELLRKGEVFILLDDHGHPSRKIGMDSYDAIRECPIDYRFGFIQL